MTEASVAIRALLENHPIPQPGRYSASMGMLTNLLPGLRDLRTPLTVGYVWVAGLWLIAGDIAPIKQLWIKLGHEYAPLASLFGTAGLVGTISVVAYLVGSLFIVDAKRIR